MEFPSFWWAKHARKTFSRLFACNQPDVCCEWPTVLKDAAHFPTMEAVASCASTFLESPTFAATTSLLIDWKSILILCSVFSGMNFHLDRMTSCEINLSCGQSDAKT